VIFCFNTGGDDCLDAQTVICGDGRMSQTSICGDGDIRAQTALRLNFAIRGKTCEKTLENRDVGPTGRAKMYVIKTYLQETTLKHANIRISHQNNKIQIRVSIFK
jgi:hypothetical protein